ncbi:hypothetical protein ACA910_022082 [Epithemia clementina (nom. ined.)]
MKVSSSFVRNAHKDVLEASIPTTDDGKNRLLEELKNRGRSAVQAGQWPDAHALYKKALECCPTTTIQDNVKQAAILHANLALVQGKMDHWMESERSGQQATTLDPTYTKGWWRLGQAQSALQKYEQAVKAFEEAQRLEPNNKALNKELTTVKQKAATAAEEEAKRKAASAAQQEEPVPMETTPTTTTTTTTTKTAEVKKSKPHKSSSGGAEPMDVDFSVGSKKNNDDDDDGTTFTKSEPVKGYKIVNGKKTSYFHNELSEEAAKLIGDIAPKKLTPDQPAASSSSPPPLEGTSAWNKAGTWEEKDVTSWAIDSLQTQLKAVSYTLPDSSPAPKAVVRTRKATVTGHASVAMVRGKKRYIFELIVKLEWEFEDAAQGHDAHGTLNFPDFDGTCEIGHGYEATNFDIQECDNPNARPLLEVFVHKQGWRDSIHACMDNWVRSF